MEAGQQRGAVFKVLRESGCSRGIPCLLKILFRNEGRMKMFLEKHKQRELAIDRTLTGPQGSGPGQTGASGRGRASWKR